MWKKYSTKEHFYIQNVEKNISSQNFELFLVQNVVQKCWSKIFCWHFVLFWSKIVAQNVAENIPKWYAKYLAQNLEVLFVPKYREKIYSNISKKYFGHFFSKKNRPRLKSRSSSTSFFIVGHGLVFILILNFLCFHKEANVFWKFWNAMALYENLENIIRNHICYDLWNIAFIRYFFFFFSFFIFEFFAKRTLLKFFFK